MSRTDTAVSEPAPPPKRPRRGLDPAVTERAESALRASLDAVEAGRLTEIGSERLAINSAAAASLEGLPSRNKLGPAFWVAVVWTGLVAFSAIFCNILPIDNPNATLVGPPNQGPSLHHFFGTDLIGHDLFSQVVWGCRSSVIIGASAVAAGVLIGGGIGVIAGFYRGVLDVIVVWIVDVLLTLPGLILLLAIVTFLGGSFLNSVIAIDILSIPAFARIARAATLAISQQNWVLTQLALGSKPRRILRRDILPLVLLPVVGYVALGASIAIIAYGGLAFLGLTPPNVLAWGTMIANGQNQLINAPWLTFAPMIVFFLTIAALNYIGQTFAAALDPRAAAL